MPNYKGHFFGACLFYFALLMILSLYTKSINLLIFWFVCTILGALFPDIDTSSKGKKLFYSLMLLSALFCAISKNYVNFLLIIFFVFLTLISNHRGIFHKLWFLLSISMIIAYKLISLLPMHQNLIISGISFFILGIFSHLWLDLGFKNVLKLK